MQNVHAIVFSHSQSYDLSDLIEHRCIGSVPFGGRYRLIDFTLSSLTNSNIENVGIITQNNYLSLMNHIENGREWDLSRKNGGLTFLPPFGNSYTSGFYRGKIEALANSIDYIKSQKTKYFLIQTADNIMNINYQEFIDSHIKSKAEISVIYKKMEVFDHQENHIIKVGPDNFVRDMLIKPKINGKRNVLLNILCIEKGLLVRMIEENSSRNQFSLSKDIVLPAIGRNQVNAFEFTGYASKLHDIKTYYDLNMELLKAETRHALFPREYPIYTKIRDEAPVYFGSHNYVSNSFMADGCIIEGEVENSILFRGVHVKPGSSIKNSIIMQGTKVGEGAKLNYIITDKNVEILDGRNLLGSPEYPSFIKKGSIV